MATVEYWTGENGEEYTKDEYGNVFSQYGLEGNDPYQQQQQQGPWTPGGTGPWSLQLPGQAPQYGGGWQPEPPRDPWVPANYTWNPSRGTWDAPGYGGGGGQMGGGMPPGYGGGVPQYNMGQDTNMVRREELAGNMQIEQQKLAAQMQSNQAKQAYDQQYLAYLQQQLAQQGKTDAERLAIDRERVGIERQLAALKQQEFELAKQADEFKRGMQVTEVLGNPRSLAQSLMLLGANPAQAAGYLQNTPLVQGLGAQAGVGQQQGWAPPAGGMTLQGVQSAMGGLPNYQQLLQTASSATGAGSIDPTTGRNTLFPFISGRKLPVQQTLGDIQSQSQNVPLIAGLASFSGQNPESFFGEFGSFLPKGNLAAPVTVR